ncbi:MAG: carbonic anhydrase family protein, partial [Methylovulum sp.]|nr:carbonic anhydrase family protein [Methylovulum sp.]
QPFIKRQRFCQLFSGVLVTIIVAISINEWLQAHHPELALNGSHLVVLPVMDTMGDFISQLNAPDFAAFNQPNVYWVAVTLALVASLETLIAVEAIDKLDSYRRATPANRELIVQGIGNISAALLGGLPLTQVVVRSSINVQSGARTKASAFIHGLLLLLTVILIPTWLHEIPLASLAAILLVVSYKMARPRTFKAMYQAGPYHFIPFCATIVGMVLTDILLGLAVGLMTALVSILLENHKSSFYFQKKMRVGDKIILRLSEHVSFLNKANIQQTLEALPAHSQVVIDATRSKYIDYDVFEIIENFRQEAPFRQIDLTLQNLRGYGSLPPVINARPQTFDSQQSLTPAKVLAILKEGNGHFINNLESNRNLLEQVNDTRQGQFPIAIILSCMDSRTSVELIFDQGLGDIFSTRVAGNVVNNDILGSMEYACKVAGSKLIVVLGHSHCGAIKGACSHVQLEHLTGLLAKIQPAVVAASAETTGELSADNLVLVQRVADYNVLLMVDEIKTRSPLLNAMLASGEIGIVGGMYDIETGKVRFYEEGGLRV